MGEHSLWMLYPCAIVHVQPSDTGLRRRLPTCREWLTRSITRGVTIVGDLASSRLLSDHTVALLYRVLRAPTG